MKFQLPDLSPLAAIQALAERVGAVSFAIQTSWGPFFVNLDRIVIISIFLILAGAALLILWAVMRSYAPAPETEPEIESIATAEPVEAPAEIPELQTISRQDALRIRPEFFMRKVSDELSRHLSFASSIDELLRAFLSHASSVCDGVLTVFLRNEQGDMVPRLRSQGKIVLGGDFSRVLSETNVGHTGFEILESGKPVMSEDGRQAAFSIDSPTEIAGFLLLESEHASDLKVLSRLHDMCYQFSLFMYEKIHQIENQAHSGTSGRLQLESALRVLSQASAAFSLTICEFSEGKPDISGDLIFCEGNRLYVLGGVESERTLDARFASWIHRCGPASIGIAVSTGHEEPARIFDRALRALENAKAAGLNHYRILQAA